MELWRVFMALIFPPFAVVDRGCGAFALVFLLTMAGWIPGVIAALMIVYLDSQNAEREFVEPRYVEIPRRGAKPKRKGAFVRLSDGDVLEVVDDDGLPPEDEKRKRGAGDLI